MTEDQLNDLREVISLINPANKQVSERRIIRATKLLLNMLDAEAGR